MSLQNAVERWEEQIVNRLLNHQQETGSSKIHLRGYAQIAEFFGINLADETLEGQRTDWALFTEALINLISVKKIEGASNYLIIDINLPKGQLDPEQSKFLDEIDTLLERPSGSRASVPDAFLAYPWQ